MAHPKLIEYFTEHGLVDRILVFEDSCATVDLAAEAAGVEPGQVAKSLTFWVGNEPIMVVMAGDQKVDNGKYKARFGRRPRMLSRKEVEEVVGYDAGEVCPFLINEGVPVYLDRSLQAFDRVYPAAGSTHSLIGLNLEELQKHSGSQEWVEVGRAR